MIQLQASNQTELSNIYNLMARNAPLTDAQKSSIYGQTVGALNDAIPSFVETLKNQDYRSAAFVGVQPLFMGGKLIAAKKYSSAEEEAAKQELEKIKNEIINEVIKSYTQNLLQRKIVETRKNVLAGMEQHRANANKLYEQGVIANYHLLRAEVAVAEAERNLQKDENNLELTNLAFNSLIGLPLESNAIFIDSLKYVELPDSLVDLLGKAEYTQPILKIIEQKKIAATQNYNIIRSNLLPQIAAFGKYELYTDELSALEPTWAVGISAKINIFNGFKDYLKLQSANAIENEVDFIMKDAEKKIALWINKTYRDVHNNADEYIKLNANLNLAEENFRQNSKRFFSGLGTSLEVIDSRLSLEKVEIDLDVSLYNYYTSLADLQNATGNGIDFLNIWNK
jgi:outer membrane protein TolC